MSIQTSITPEDRRRRRALQVLFIFANLALVEVHVPGVPWVIVGAVFWASMVLLAVVGGSWMCGWVCWIGGIQDLMEPLARARVRLNPRWGQGITLALLVVWVPLFWWLFPEASSAVYTPFGLNLDGWPRHVFQFGLMLLLGLSVTFLGKRGICRYLCPFNSVVAVARRWLPGILPGIHRVQRPPPETQRDSSVAPAVCASGCHHCPTACQSRSNYVVATSFTSDLSIPLVIDPAQHRVDQNQPENNLKDLKEIK